MWMSPPSSERPTAAGLTHLGTTTQAEFLVGLGTEELLQAIQADPGDDDRVLPRGPLRALPPARPGRDGPLPGHGLRARLAADGPPLRVLAIGSADSRRPASACRQPAGSNSIESMTCWSSARSAAERSTGSFVKNVTVLPSTSIA